MNKQVRKNWLVVGLAMGLTINLSSNAMARQSSGMHGHAGKQVSTDRVLQRLDYDGDGVVTESDMTSSMIERAIDRFTRIDSDGDLSITLDEFTANPGRHQQDDVEIDQALLRECLEDTLGELPPTREARFSAADTNADSLLDTSEYTDYINTLAIERFAELDSDADGQISSEEIEASNTSRDALRQAKTDCINAQELVNE